MKANKKILARIEEEKKKYAKEKSIYFVEWLLDNSAHWKYNETTDKWIDEYGYYWTLEELYGEYEKNNK